MKQTMLKLCALALFILAGSVGFISSSFAQQQTDKPVEQTRKNIKVLNGLPESQLFPVMNFISNALGVNCAYCHVRTGETWEFEKDDKPEKATARKMMLMQFSINKGNRDIFGTTAAITCYTCHRGQTKPAVMPMLPATPMARGAVAKPAEGLPTVDQVLEKYVQAIGGKAAFEKLNTRVMKGTHTLPDGTALPVETYQATPNKLVSVMTTKNGAVMNGYNGTTGWSKNPRGQRELSGAQLEQMRRAADFYADVKPRESFPNLTFIGRDKIGDRDVYVLESKATGNSSIEKLYFDTQTGLLLRILSITQSLLAPLPAQTDFEDYREVDGVKLPFTIRQSFIDYRNDWTRKYTEIKHNVPIEDTKFNPPPPAPAPTPKQ
jgi:hypothetical protein